MAKFGVYGMCNPLFDLQVEISDSLLQELGYEKGSMNLVDHEAQGNLIPKVYEHIVNAAAGGSGANTLYHFGLLGGAGCYTGHVGLDEHGRMYRESLESNGIRANLGESNGETGTCVVMITPDAERTMVTYLGKALSLLPQDIYVPDLVNSQYLYITGYLWDTEEQKSSVEHAMKTATTNGVKVAFSLSDPFCVHRHPDDFMRLIKDHVDVLFGNEAEVQALTGLDDPEQAAIQLSKDADLVAVTLGAEGSILVRNGEVTRCPALKIVAVDSTGAGDAYAAGVLYGLTEGKSLAECGKIGGAIAGRVVAQLGPRLSAIDPADLA